VEPRASLECLCSWILFDLEISFILYIYIYIFCVCVLEQDLYKYKKFVKFY
jgi:hypothetical protein